MTTRILKKGEKMKKFLLPVVAAALLFGLATSVSADVAERGFVSVSATANTELPPDVVEINFAVQTSDAKSLQKATEENKVISDKIYNALSSMINKNNGDYIKTADFSAAPIYSYKNDKKNLLKYEVNNSVIVHTKSISDAGKMIDKAISLGATNVNDITFSISAYDKQCNDLLNAAAKKAYTRAEMLAASSYGTLSGIKSLNGSCTTSDNARVQYRMLAKNMSFGASADSAVQESSSPIQGGVIKLFANVNASYFVK